MSTLFYTTKYKFKDKKEHFEQPIGESMTVQGETLSIQQLLQRYQNGIPLNTRPVQYLDEEDLNKISRFNTNNLDLTDIEALGRHVQELQEVVRKAQTEKERHERELAMKNQLRLELEKEKS